MLLLLACVDQPGPTDTGKVGTPDDTDTDSETGAETGDTDTAPPIPFTCPDVLDAPELSTETWSAAGLAPATGIRGFGAPETGWPVYVESILTGVWRADGPEPDWYASNLQTTHTYGQLVLDAADPYHVFRSAGGIVERTYDGGVTWEQLDAGDISVPSGGILAVGGNPPEVWAVSQAGAVFYSEDDGDNFDEISSVPAAVMESHNPYDHTWRFLAPTDDDTYTWFADSHLLSRGDSSGDGWQAMRDGVAATGSVTRAGARLYVGSDDGYAWTEDAGETWTEESLGWGADFIAVDPGSGAVAMAAEGHLVVDGVAGTIPQVPTALGWVDGWLLLGFEGGVAASADQGATWEDWSSGIVDPGMSVVAPHPECPGFVFIGSRCSGGVLRSFDWGASFEPDTAEFFHYVMGIHWDPSELGRVWVVSDKNLLASEDGGETFRFVYSAYHFHGFAVDPADSQHLLLGSVGSGGEGDPTGGRVYVSRDGGSTWTLSADGLSVGDASAHTIAWWPDNPDVVLMGSYAAEDMSHLGGSGIGLYRSEDGGEHWSRAETGDVVDFAWLTEGPGGMWAATSDGLMASTDEGQTWTLADVDGDFVSVDFEGDLGLAYTEDGHLYRSDDAGVSWSSFDAGLPNAQSPLAQVAIAPDASMAWVTVYASGVYWIGL